MHPIQELCLELSVCPINGEINNEFSNSVRQKFSHQVLQLSMYDLLEGVVNHFTVKTNFDRESETYKKQIMHNVSVVLNWCPEPLVLDLMPAHMMFPRFPERVFDVIDDGEGMGRLVLKENNPWFDNIEEAYKVLTLVYLSLTKMVGYDNLDDTKVIESVRVDVANKTHRVIYQESLTPEILSACLAMVSERLNVDEGEGALEHFALHFMGGMLQENAHAPKKITIDGKAAVQNGFEPKDWTQEQLAQPIQEHFTALSFDSIGNCPAYVRQLDRARVYSSDLFKKMGILSFPLVKNEHGVDAEDYEAFTKLPAAEAVFAHITNSICEFADKSDLKLGDMIALHHSLKKSGVQ